MGVKVNFLSDQPPEQSPSGAVLVPADAIREEAGQPVVFRYRDGRVERRAVSLGAARGGEQEILAGLSQGDSVVLRPSPNLQDGDAVELSR